MTWIRFIQEDVERFGLLENGIITTYSGDMFNSPISTGETIAVEAVQLIVPVQPGKIIGMANNYHALIEKGGGTVPEEPLYFIKANTSLNSHGRPVRRPKAYAGKIIFEGELGLVIGRRCHEVAESVALGYLFGCTCVNDVTAIGLLKKDPSFLQWTRSKAADTFGVIGPCIATDLDPSGLRVTTTLNDQERQNYPVADMVFTPAQLISRLSHDMTLDTGDVIACGTSVGVGSMRHGDVVTVSIQGVGAISNTFED